TIETLRYRWAAMNPPSTDDDDNGYIGSEPLDAALADRFAFVVEMPSWSGLCEQEQLAIIRADTTPISPGDRQELAGVLDRTRSILPSMNASLSDGMASYTRTLVALLAEAGFAVSPRRAGMLFRSALAV